MPTPYVVRVGQRMRSTQGRHTSQPCLAEGETVAGDDGCEGGAPCSFTNGRHTPRRRSIQYTAAFRFIAGVFGILDRPPSRATTIGVCRRSFAISPHALREVWPARSALSIQRAQGMPGARCTRSLVCARVVSMHTSIHSESPESSGIPRAMVYGLYRALPGDRLSCHRRLRIISAKLDASTEASGPHVFAVRVSIARQARRRVHRPPPRVRDVRETPL
jgi:hypothetical protein